MLSLEGCGSCCTPRLWPAAAAAAAPPPLCLGGSRPLPRLRGACLGAPGGGTDCLGGPPPPALGCRASACVADCGLASCSAGLGFRAMG